MVGNESPFLTCATAAAEWMFGEAFVGHGATPGQLHEVFDAAWKQTASTAPARLMISAMTPHRYGNLDREGIASQPYLGGSGQAGSHAMLK